MAIKKSALYGSLWKRCDEPQCFMDVYQYKNNPNIRAEAGDGMKLLKQADEFPGGKSVPASKTISKQLKLNKKTLAHPANPFSNLAIEIECIAQTPVNRDKEFVKRQAHPESKPDQMVSNYSNRAEKLLKTVGPSW